MRRTASDKTASLSLPCPSLQIEWSPGEVPADDKGTSAEKFKSTVDEMLYAEDNVPVWQQRTAKKSAESKLHSLLLATHSGTRQGIIHFWMR